MIAVFNEYDELISVCGVCWSVRPLHLHLMVIGEYGQYTTTALLENNAMVFAALLALSLKYYYGSNSPNEKFFIFAVGAITLFTYSALRAVTT